MQWLLHRRMGANQRMRWSPRGAHRMLQVRTAAANGTLADDHAAAERMGPPTVPPRRLTPPVSGRSPQDFRGTATISSALAIRYRFAVTGAGRWCLNPSRR